MNEIDPIFEFEVINIKLQTEKNDLYRHEAYKNIILGLVKLKCHSAVGENKHLIIYSATPKITDDGVEYIYGRIGKGIYFSDEKGSALDIENSKTEDEKFDTKKIYNPNITDYVFIPAAHRICVRLGDKISGNDVRKFLLLNAKFVVDEKDKIEIEIEKEETAITELLTAKKVHKIDYSISYTNDDTLGASASLFDRRLKKSQIGKLHLKAEADHHDFMEIKGEEILEGGIELAKSNGNINSADITTITGVRKTISSKDKPKKIKIKSDYEVFRKVVVSTIMLMFRSEL